MHLRIDSLWLQLFRLWIRRDLRSRYARTLGGGFWALASPLLTIALFYFLFTHVFRVRVPELAAQQGYFFFLVSGLLPWLTIAEGLNRATGSILAQEDFLQKQAMPLAILPATAVLAALVPQLVGTLALFVWFFLSDPSANISTVLWFFWPLLLLLQLAMTLGAALGLSALAVHLRDLTHAVPVMTQFLFYATPILYSLSMVGEDLRFLFLLNPFAPLIAAHQSLLLGIPFPSPLLLSGIVWFVVLTVGGSLLFHILRPTIAGGR